MILIIILLVIVTIGLVFGLVYINNQLKDFKTKNTHNESKINELFDEKYNLQMKNDNLREDLFKLSEARNLLEIQVNLTADEKNRLEAKLNSLQEEYTNLQVSTSVNAVKNDSKESLEAELENLKALAVEKMSELQQITANTQKLAESQNEKLEEIAKLEAGIKALEGRICSGREVLESIEGQIKITNHELDELAHLKASILAVEEGAGQAWTFNVLGDKKRLIELIHQLVDEYGNQFPILRKELLKAEWSSVWLPQVQQLCSREGLDRSGIYRLTLKSNSDVVYIGQAQSIKDRWYTHIKKMLGVEAKGTERLYEYRPDDFEWSVVEFKEGNLDSDEKYWIDYYKCREIGLNKKG